MPTEPTHTPLMPCPFCGSTDIYAPSMQYWGAHCHKCGCCLNESPSEEKAIAAWNTRAPSPVTALRSAPGGEHTPRYYANGEHILDRYQPGKFPIAEMVTKLNKHAALLAALQDCLNSAKPHPEDNPTMFAAWKKARAAIAAATPEGV